MSRILGLTVCPYRKKQKIGRNIEKRQMWENFAKIVQILCTRVCKWKNETCWKYSRNGGRRNKIEQQEKKEKKKSVSLTLVVYPIPPTLSNCLGLRLFCS
jgi:hypothetical protein